MPTIYLNNFRGFNDTFLKLKNVNFFVGENSTGKTSILKLIRVLSDISFWFSFEFGTSEVEGLGYFSEISSDSSRKEFEVGILSDHELQNSINAVLIKFRNKDGLPKIETIRLVDNQYDIEIIVKSDEVIKFRYVEVENKEKIAKERHTYFKIWVSKNQLKGKVYEEFRTEGMIPLGPLIFNIQDIIEKNKDKSIKFKFRLPRFLDELVWLAPIRAKPKRTYDEFHLGFSPEGNHSPYLLKNLLSNSGSKSRITKILNRFGEDSGLFNRVEISNIGREKSSPFELLVCFGESSHKISNVGYGVSQILPLIIEICSSPQNAWFAIQQPEIHLHPRAQAAFGDFLLKSYLEERKNFVIETHSDYTIDRFRLRLKSNKSNKKGEHQVVFFKRKDGANSLYCIDINSNGSYSNEQPKEFKDFFIKEQIELLNL